MTTSPKSSTKIDERNENPAKKLKILLTFQVDLTAFTSVPLEALARDLIIRLCHASAMIVTPFTSGLFWHTNSSRVNRIFRLVSEAFNTAARVSAQQIEAMRVIGTVVVLVFTRALIKVVSFQIAGQWVCIKISAAQIVIRQPQVFLDRFLQLLLVRIFRQLNEHFTNDTILKF